MERQLRNGKVVTISVWLVPCETFILDPRLTRERHSVHIRPMKERCKEHVLGAARDQGPARSWEHSGDDKRPPTPWR